MQDLIIGLGSNIGDRRKAIERAIELIGERIGRITASSTLAETDPWGFDSLNKFLNCAIIVSDDSGSGLNVRSRITEIIGILQSIEHGFGRLKSATYTDRAIDLDILFYGDVILNESGIIIPHPRLHERDFVLASLMEICPEKIHPVIEKSVKELWEEINRRDQN